MFCLVRLFDGKIYIPTTCHNHLSRNEISCQAVFTKISLDYIPNELKDLKKKKKEKQLISKRMILKKEIMHGKGKFTKINELTVVFVTSPLKQQIFGIFWQDLQIQTD